MKRADPFAELSALFFSTRQIIRSNLRGEKPDQNAWLRCETLRFVDSAHNPTMHDIARRLRVTPPSATSLVIQLEKAGWVRREKRSGDKRVVRVSLTTRGKRSLAQYRKKATITMHRVFSKLPRREVDQLVGILRRVNEAHDR
jgi:DNA-binding MarR family transcriptional regulator